MEGLKKLQSVHFYNTHEKHRRLFFLYRVNAEVNRKQQKMPNKLRSTINYYFNLSRRLNSPHACQEQTWIYFQKTLLGAEITKPARPHPPKTQKFNKKPQQKSYS